MPFTLSHVAAVLPWRRRCHVDTFAALAIGSMMPDLHYFLPVLRKQWPLPSHQLISLPLFCVPVGWLLWRWWRPLWSTPDASGQASPPPACWRLLLALALGALTHLAWDACTHAHYGLGRYLPVLGQALPWPRHPTFNWANLLQYLSSVAGLLYLAVVAWPARRRLLQGMRSGVPTAWLLLASALAAVLAAALTFACCWRPDDSAGQLRHTIRLTAWNGLSSPLLIVLVYPLLWRLRQRKSADAPAQPA